MSRDRNFERRMIVSKYSNRPPFDLKKPKEFFDIADKMKAYPDEACRNCCRNRSGKLIKEPARPCKSLPINNDPEKEARIPAVKKVIPKIIKNFQKITPSKEITAMSQNTSIQTLYRNPKPCRLGKNIPKHKLMNSLLQNLDSEAENCKKSLSDFARGNHKVTSSKDKCNDSKKLLFDKDEVIRPDFSVSLDMKRNSSIKDSGLQEARSRICYQMPQKINKRTSTTGLLWPPKSKEMLRYPYLNVPSNPRFNNKAAQSCHCQKTSPIKCRNLKEELKNNAMSELSSESYLEETPTKDMNRPTYIPKAPVQSNFKNRKSESNDRFRQKPPEASKLTLKPKTSPANVKPEKRPEFQAKNSISKLRSREKTFVQAQVEKLNKVMIHTKIPQYQNQHVRTTRRDLGRDQGDVPGRREAAANYIGLMDKVRTNCPQYDQSDNCQNLESDHDWSDSNVESELVPEQIKFPRETKTAIDQRLSDKRQRLPLSTFTKVHDCRPAIQPEIKFNREVGHFGGNAHVNHYKGPSIQEKQKATKNRDPRKHDLAQNRAKLNLPCKKNLLCDKGEQHSGPCGYTHNYNKVIY